MGYITSFNQEDINNIKKGDIVTVLSCDRRHTDYPKECKVVSKGKKYITIDNYCLEKYEVDGGYRVDWNDFYIYPGTIEQYRNYVDERDKHKVAVDKLYKICEKLSSEEVNDIISYTDKFGQDT